MDLLTEFRRTLLKKIEKLPSDEFYTKKEISGIVAAAYTEAKTECEEVSSSSPE
jgi:hypothetical protein